MVTMGHKGVSGLDGHTAPGLPVTRVLELHELLPSEPARPDRGDD